MKKISLSLATLALSLMTSMSQAHFIFVVTDSQADTKVAQVFFSDSAEPDDPALLKNIEKAQTWVIGERGKTIPIELKIDGDVLSGEIPERFQSNTVLVNHNYGVMNRGDDPFLLMYYAKTYPTGSLPGNWSRVNKEAELPLEIVPELSGNEVSFKVYWQGKALAASQVTVAGPGLAENIQGDTDENGVFTTKLAEAGRYAIRARYIEQKSGEQDEKSYKLVKHYSTLTFSYTPVQLKPTEHQWPRLVQGSTSLGATVVGDDLYVYGGNYGGGHEYSEEDQSGDFRKLDLKSGQAWENITIGPKLTGLAMVAHDGKVYRIGGFTVTDLEGGQAELNSQNSFARFDPATGAWEDLTPLPEPRSSHDAVVIGDTLYVVGGWSMVASSGNNNHGWLKSIYSINLNDPKAQWQALPAAPFERRALSAAAHEGKLYVIGGMQSSDGTTTKVEIFNPETSEWTSGPNIQGNSMDGFGTASFAVDGNLVVTTMSGSIQKLSNDGTHWDYVGQLKSPRFFHEMLPYDHGLVVVGGASMMSGKAEALEYLPVGEAKTSSTDNDESECHESLPQN